MRWIFLILAILFEVVGTTMLKLSNGFTKPIYSFFIFVSYLGSLSLLTLSLKYFQISIAYAIWSGLGIVGIVLIGHLFFNDNIDFVKAIFIILIVIGIVGLNLSIKH